MSDDLRGLEGLRFEYLIPEFARPDFKLPKEEPIEKGNEPMGDKEPEWTTIGRLISVAPLINTEDAQADTKGNKPMDEELFQRVEVNIEKFTRAAMDLQAAVIYAEDQLKDAKQRWIDAEKSLEIARQRWVDAEKSREIARQAWTDEEKKLVEVRGQLRHHLDSVRGMKATMPAPPDFGQNVYKVSERDE